MAIINLFRRKKTPTLIISVFIVVLYFIVPEPTHKQSHIVYKEPYDDVPKVSGAKCEKIPPIYYVKIHKTGSSTLQNILQRVGLKQNLFFALFSCPYGMTYPHPPEEEYTFMKPTAKNFTGYHLITDHTMYDPMAYRSYMPADTKVITLLRHPLKQLKSSFGFWNLPEALNMPPSEDALADFLKQPKKYEKTRASFGCSPTIQISQTKNPQSHHLGLKNQSVNTERPVDEFIRGLDKNLSLVLILERFEESLILMKRMFCFSTQDIIHLSLFSTKFFNRHTYDYKAANEMGLIEKHRRYSIVDYMLYEHFESKLDHTIQEQGAEFQMELESFKGILDNVRKFCNESCDVFSQLVNEDVGYVRDKLLGEFITVQKTHWNEEFTVSRGDCGLMMFETLIYNDAIKAKQWPDKCGFASRTSKNVPLINRNYCNKQDFFVPNFSWSSLKGSAYFRKSTCQKGL